MTEIQSENEFNSIDNQAIDSEHIRKVWHKGEWYFSVVDIIAEASERSQENATEYWRKLRNRLAKEGNQTVTNLDALKLRALDGKMRETQVVNKQQALRLLQEIPGARTDSVKNWLAAIGAEHIEESEDPEAAMHRVMESISEKYRRAGKSESWISARVQGIVTRKQFVEALKAAVLNAPPTLYAQATDKLYVGLWERTTAQLRGDLNLTPRQNPRDSFGEYALIYTRLAEMVATDKLDEIETVTFSMAMEIVWEVAKLIHTQASATAQALGIDLVTERRLLKS